MSHYVSGIILGVAIGLSLRPAVDELIFAIVDWKHRRR